MRRASDEPTLPLRLRAGVDDVLSRRCPPTSGNGHGHGKADDSGNGSGNGNGHEPDAPPGSLRRTFDAWWSDAALDEPESEPDAALPAEYRRALQSHWRSPQSPRYSRQLTQEPQLQRRRSRRRRRLYPLVAVGLVVLLFFVSVIGAASTPGNEDFKSKWADWLRGHHLSALVTPLEQWYYNNQAPSKGGQPRALNALPGTQGGTVPVTVAGRSTTGSQTGSAAPTTLGTIPVKGSTTQTTVPGRPASNAGRSPATTKSGLVVTHGVAHLPAPAPVPLVVSPGLAGEGQWLPVGPQVHGVPGMYEAQFRADNVYTSQITSAVWIDPTLLKVSLVPGAQEPGGTWTETPDLTGQSALRAVAAFNGGFRFQDAHGGFYLDGRQAVPLRSGAASIVIYDSGRIDVGLWGTEVTMTPQVKAVLQNLVPIVDHGQPAPSATYGDASIWGATLGAQTVIARSGVGVTADGALVYVAGPALTAKSLAESLQRAGAVRAMALDLNPEWVTFNFFHHDAAGNVSGTKLYPEMQRSADRYLGPNPESRDFFAVSTAG